MRNIKFRGKRKDNGEWIYGFPFITEFASYILKEIIVQVKPNDVNGPKEFDNDVVWIEVVPETVGEFTGLHDKNGREIYEEDLVGEEGFYQKIIFRDGAFRITADNTPLQEWLWKRMRSGQSDEVIGNIYENAELLAGQNERTESKSS
jgi:uncharacterized phage protein (TIGR01671 family)